MNGEVFDYELPREKIAQYPAGLNSRRDTARLLCGNIAGGSLSISDKTFADLPSLLRSDDLLILNNSKVLPSRFFARTVRQDAAIEVLLETELERSASSSIWQCFCKPLKKVKEGDELCLSPSLKGVSLGRDEEGGKLKLKIYLAEDAPISSIAEAIQEEALMPIPPYIRNGQSEELDKSLYQTVFAEIPGSIAAPTAGLHFTPELIGEIKRRGVAVEYVTHHVGAASFTTLDAEKNPALTVPKEFYVLSRELAEKIRTKKLKGGRVVVVGTTSTRALESWAQKLDWQSGELGRIDELTSTELCIRPGFEFRVVDALITNFHQPKTTHLYLVSAFFGKENVEALYEHALKGEYRFLSYGDAMLLEYENRSL